MIKITNLNKYFYHHKPNQIHVINDVTLEFPETGLVTIIGESGSGKTTLMNVLGGLDDFESGTIEIDDIKIHKYSSKQIDRIRNEKIGYIFQNYLLLQQRTVYENLELLLDMYDISPKEKNERIEYVLKAVGMLKYKKKNVSELSGGQQQRVAIARALIKSPSLILADEPTGNLDEKNTIQIMNIIKKISQNTLVILVSHEENIASSYSDYIINFSDGKVVNNSLYTDSKIYKYEDDQNIYLKEFETVSLRNDLVSIDYYDNDSKKIELKIIQKNGKFFIYSNEEIVVVNNESETKIIDDYKQDLNVEQEILENDYDLPVLEFIKTPRLSFKEQISLAFQNLNKLKKRINFLAIPLILISVLVLFSVQSIKTASFVDRQSLVSTDSRIYNISLEKGYSSLSDEKMEEAFGYFYDDFFKENPNIEPILNYTPTLSFNLPDFKQLTDAKYNLAGFSILPLEKVNQNQIIHGRMPIAPNEVVIDKWVIENTINDTVAANFMNIGSFIGIELTSKNFTYPLKIVGIVESGNNTLYVNKWTMFDIYPSNIRRDSLKLCSISDVEAYLGKDLGYDLGPREALMSFGTSYPYQNNDLVLNGDSNLSFKILDQVSFGDCPFFFAVAEETYDEILKSVMTVDYLSFTVCCDDENEIKQVEEYLESIKSAYLDGNIHEDLDSNIYKIALYNNSNYFDKLNPYLEEARENVFSRTLITIAIVVIALVIVFFSMKSFSIKNIYDTGVYRAIGISKGSIAFVYGIEIFIISLKTIFVGTTLCFFIANFITSIPLINAAFSIDLLIYIITTVGLIILNVIVGVLPVISCLRLTPSKILTRYDV